LREGFLATNSLPLNHRRLNQFPGFYYFFTLRGELLELLVDLARGGKGALLHFFDLARAVREAVGLYTHPFLNRDKQIRQRRVFHVALSTVDDGGRTVALKAQVLSSLAFY
jgi:hypothetical protein